MVLSKLLMTNLYDTIAQILRILAVELTVGCRTAERTFFIMEAKVDYNALLGRGFIHSSMYSLSSLYQYLILGLSYGSIEIVSTDSKIFFYYL